MEQLLSDVPRKDECFGFEPLWSSTYCNDDPNFLLVVSGSTALVDQVNLIYM